MLRPHAKSHYDEPVGCCRRILQAPAFRALVVTIALWLLAFTYCNFRYWRNPHSAFFHSEHVYDLEYSAYRQEEARAYQKGATTDVGLPKAGKSPEICAAITTIKREGLQYLEDTVGSLLAGLTEAERAKVWITIFFADTDPEVYPMYHEPWIRNAVDEIASFNLSAEAMEKLQEKEQSGDYMKKAIFDYTYVLNTCLAKNTPFILMLEDDLILTPTWLGRTLHALQTLKQTTHGGWIYLRLFFTETSLKWRTTDFWYHHIVLTFSLISLTSSILLLFLRTRSPTLRPHLPNSAIFTLVTITTPAFVALTFMIGKYSLFPPSSHEVFKLNAHGCCAQALLYPRSEVKDLVKWLDWKKEGDTDTLVEVYANENGLDRWALGRQVVQHVGTYSSRGHSQVDTQGTWAFWFEEYEGRELEREHRWLVSEGF